jgi:hypothetical protein
MASPILRQDPVDSDHLPTAPSPEATAAQQDDLGYDLLLYGHEQILRASDTGVLVAFAALAFQQIRGGNPLPHYNVGFGFLIFSVLMCGVVHFALGSVYLGRGRRLIRGQEEKLRHLLTRGVYTLLAWGSGLLQFVLIALGLILILNANPPEWLQEYVLKYFSGAAEPNGPATWTPHIR